MANTLRLTDDLRYRIALVRWCADRDDPSLAQRKCELADAIVATLARPSRADRLASVPRPTPAHVDALEQPQRGRRRA